MSFRNFLTPTRLRSFVPETPSVDLQFGEKSPYNASKVALLIENRASGLLAPLIIHFMAVLPPDWRFRFMGSIESVAKIHQSAAIRRKVKSGKLDLTLIPSNYSTAGQEQISSFLTDHYILEEVLRPAEWLLVFQTDSMVCGKQQGSLDDWLQYDWVGAPWNHDSSYGGNGGLSLRRISSMVAITEYQQRQGNTEPEDVWLTDKLGHMPTPRTANGTESMKFSVESIWYDEPLGYHIGGSGAWLNPGIYGPMARRQHIWDYCPEMKMVIDMDTSASMPKACTNIF